MAAVYATRDSSYSNRHHQHSRHKNRARSRSRSRSRSHDFRHGVDELSGAVAEEVPKRRGFGPWVDPETAFAEDLPTMNIMPHHDKPEPTPAIPVPSTPPSSKSTSTTPLPRTTHTHTHTHTHTATSASSSSSSSTARAAAGGVRAPGAGAGAGGGGGTRVDEGTTGYWNEDSHLLRLIDYEPDLVLLAMRTLQLLSTPCSGVLLLVSACIHDAYIL